MNTRNLKTVAAAAVLAFGLSGCSATGMGTKQGVGTVLGGVVGGVVGSQFGGGTGKLVATGVGTLLGGWLGNEIGASLDKADELALQSTAQTALEKKGVGEAVVWTNPETGTRVETVVVNENGTPPAAAKGKPAQKPASRAKRADQASAEPFCREYQQKVTVGGKAQEAFGKACLQPDGSWKVANS